MASKLDELMALADQFACEQGFLAMGHSNASKDMAAGARDAIQSALKALVEDAERYCTLEREINRILDAARKP